MSEPSNPAAAPDAAAAAAALAQLRERAERLLVDILGMMGFPARLDVRDAEGGGLSVALHFEGGALPPGVEVGKRSQVMDALQFLLNKMLHRPGQERRHVALGCGVHPELRAPQGPRAPAAAPAAARPTPVPAPARAAAPAALQPPPAAAARPPAAPKAPPAAAARPRDSDERTLEVAEDAALQQAARLLAQKSSSLGRFYALAAMNPEDRARVLKGVEGVAGVRVACEGEGRNRRVVFTPEKPSPLPRRSALPDDDDEDFED